MLLRKQGLDLDVEIFERKSRPKFLSDMKEGVLVVVIGWQSNHLDCSWATVLWQNLRSSQSAFL